MLTSPGDLLQTGIDIVVQPPGKRLQSMTLLSGGEKALTAVALIFSIFQLKPTPFCILDEVDAPLDEANVTRFAAMVREMSATSQFLIITHNKRTMEVAGTLYGVTMEEPGVSKVVGVLMQQRAGASPEGDPASTRVAPADLMSTAPGDVEPAREGVAREGDRESDKAARRAFAGGDDGAGAGDDGADAGADGERDERGAGRGD